VLSPQAKAVFVGRQREMELLRAALASAIDGQGRMVMLAGEPGIGKTRLAQEVANHAADQGATVRWGRCWEGEGAPAFWPWIQILRAQIGATEPTELQEQLGTGAGELTRLVPELQTRLPGLATAGPLEDDAGARFRLFDSVATFLSASAAAQPFVLILEDLHWADAESLDLLRFLADGIQDSRLLIVGTYRDVEAAPLHPLSEVLGALAYHPVMQRVQLEGLSEAEIGELIESLGCERSASLVAQVHRQSGGNPFFAAQIARAAGHTGLPAVVPGGVRDAIVNRLRRLSEGTNRLLQIASVIGPEFDLGTLERAGAEVAASMPIVQRLSEALEARIVDEVTEAAAGYRFSHALIREVLYASLPLEERLSLHWQIGTALEDLGVPEREHGASALAHHFLEAIAGCAEGADRQACIDKAVLYATRAAEQAKAMVAYDSAAAHYERAVRTLEAWAPRETRRRCELLLLQGEALTRAGAGYTMRSEAFHRAAALARALGDAGQLARAALGLGLQSSTEQANDAQISLLREALDAAGDQDSTVRAQLLGWWAMAQPCAETPGHSAPLSEQALAMARRLGDPRALWPALPSRYLYLAVVEPGQAEERMTLATESVELGEQIGDREVAMYGRLYRLRSALELGQLSTLERELGVFTRMADTLGQPFFRWRAAAMHAALALLQGRFASADQMINDALPLMRRAENPYVFTTWLWQTYLSWWEQDRLAEIESSVTAWISENPVTPGLRAALAHLYAATVNLDRARAEINSLFKDDFDAPPPHWATLPLMALLADACVTLRETTHAPRLYAQLLPYRLQLAVELFVPLCMGSVSHHLGLLAGLMCRWDDALEHFDEAREAHERIGSPPWIANTEYASASVLIGRDQPGDRERASALLASVLKTTEDLGMRRLQRKARVLRDESDAGVAVEPEADAIATEISPFEKRGLKGICSDGSARKSPSPLLQSGTSVSQQGRFLHATFRREGDYWLIGSEAAPLRLKDRIGLRYLAVLLRNPEREFLAIDLVAAVHGGPRRSSSGEGAEHIAAAISEPYFDEEARHAYAQRIRDLRATLEEAERFNDRERARRAQAEMDLVTEELRRGIGLSGRTRPSSSPVERARVSVTKASKAAMHTLAQNDAELGRCLAATIKTGTYCSYSPEPRVAVNWRL